MLEPKKERQIRINLDPTWPEHIPDKELAVLILGSLRHSMNDGENLKFLSDGKRIICPTRKMKDAIQELFEATFEMQLFTTPYSVRLSTEDIQEIPFSDANVGIIFNEILSKLPHNPSSIWSDGEWVLCRKKETANIIADFLDDIANGHVTTTGYLNPVVDMPKCGVADRLAGYHYIDIA